MPGGRLANPPGQGTPCRVPSSPRSVAILDVLPSLDEQTTFKSDETKFTTSVSKKAWQGVRILLIRYRYFKKSPENQRKWGEKLHRQGKMGAQNPLPGGLGHGGSASKH